MLVLLIGLFLGLVFLLAGTSGAVSRFRTGRRTMRLHRRGVTVQAEVLSRRPVSDERGDAGSACVITGQWDWAHKSYKGQFTVPMSWWEEHAGISIPLRIDPNRPHIAEIPLGSGSPVGTMLLAVAFLIMAVVGIGFLAGSASVACDQAQYDFLEPFCESVRGAST
jgi:hypothetical protein